MSGQIPECWCDQERMTRCDWVVEVTIKYHRPGDPDAPVSEVPWSLTNIPQSLAQVIMQGMVDAINKRGLEIYVGWVKETCGDQEAAAKVAEAMEAVVNQS